MRDLVQKTMQRYGMLDHGAILAAVSGGCDSMSMLHVLHSLSLEMGFHLYAVHIHHGLREASDAEQRFVEQYAKTLGVPLSVKRLDISENAQNGESVEMAARRLRYEAFSKALAELPEEAVCATAHHQRDQAETVLMHVIRGSGIRGLCGMRPVRLPFVRPMLFVPYEEVRRYAEANDVPHMEDESNGDTRYLRNRVRRDLLSDWKEYNPNIERALSSLALWAQEDEAYLMELAGERYARLGAISLPGLAVWMPREGLAALPIPLIKRIARMALEDVGVFHLEESMLTGAVNAVRENQTVQLQKDVYVRSGYDLQVYRRKEPYGGTVSLRLGECVFGEFVLSVSAECSKRRKALWKAEICRDLLPELSARTRRKGDRIAYAFGTKKLGRALIDAHIPYCIRDHLPVMVWRDEIVWAPGLRVPKRFWAGQGDQALTISIYAVQHGGAANE